MRPVGRPTKTPPQWQALANAVGGVIPLCQALGVTKLTYWRTASGHTTPRRLLREKISELARLHAIEDPLPPFCTSAALRELELFGDDIRQIEETRKRLRSIWPERELIEIAETNEDENVLRAVTRLLEEP